MRYTALWWRPEGSVAHSYTALWWLPPAMADVAPADGRGATYAFEVC